MIALALALVGVLGAADGGADAGLLLPEKETRLDTGLTPRVRIDTLGGVLEVTAHDEGTVVVRARVVKPKRNPWRVETKQSGDQVVIRVCCGACDAPKAGCGKGASARMVLRVPDRTDLGITATSASVSVVGVKGPVAVETVTGGISAEGTAAPLRLGTVSGDIAAAPDRIAETHVTTDTGNVLLKLPEKEGAELKLSTVSGTFNGEAVPVKTRSERYGDSGPPIEVQTVTGALRIERR